MDHKKIRENLPPYHKELVPNGSNDFNSLKSRFNESDKYRSSVPTGEDVYGPNMANLRDDPLRVLYGKVDFQGMVVKPKKEYLKSISGAKDSVLVLDFVADLYDEMMEYHEKLKSTEVISQNSMYHNIIPKRGWVDVDSAYEDQLFGVEDALIMTISEDAEVERNIKNYKDFEDFYLSRINNLLQAKQPYSKVEFTVSARRNNRAFSALSVDIRDDFDCSRDAEKYLVYIRDVDFPNMRQVANRFGFRMDFNAPWRLVCDLNNPVVQERLMLRGIYSFDQFFERFYDRVHVEFIEMMKDSFIRTYNNFQSLYPVYEEIKICPRSKRLKLQIKNRMPITEDIYNKIPMSHWYKIYTKIRSRERCKKFDEHKISRIVNLAASYHLARGNTVGVDYIESKFIDRTDEIFKDRLTKGKLSAMIEDNNNYGRY